MTLVAAETVTVTVEGERKCSFACPGCGRKIALRNAFPAGFVWKQCSRCRFVWTNLTAVERGIGPHADDLAPDTTFELVLVSTGPSA